MTLIAPLTLVMALWTGQSDGRPAYAREGDRVEQEFLTYRDRLNAFFIALRAAIEQEATSTAIALPRLQQDEAPPLSATRFGYGILPRIVDVPVAGVPPVSVFSYSWPITEGYIAGENEKLRLAEAELQVLRDAPGDEKTKHISSLVREYRNLLINHRTIDQYLQYNQFWQQSIAQDRARFDQLTKVYELMKSDASDIAKAIREVLGKPDVPSFVSVDRSLPNCVILRVPLYTDIQDDEFLSKAKQAIEKLWQASDSDEMYLVQVEIRKIAPLAEQGARVDVRLIAAQFPEDGGVLMTGAQTTHSFVGRYVALAPGDLSTQTLAHEFGHVLGFRDGYIRGYRDLGERGFEILELTSVFDDIMSAPREGHVQPAHFKLILDSISNRN